jgi:hypothetical protein
MLTDAGQGGPATPVTLPCENRNESFADMVERLFRDYESSHSLAEIVDVAQQARRDLSDAPPGAQPELIERLARQRLADLPV